MTHRAGRQTAERVLTLDLPFSSDYFPSLFSDAQVQPNITKRIRDMAIMQSLVANGFDYSIANIRLATNRTRMAGVCASCR